MFGQLRVTVRLLLKNPGFTTIAIIPLALGIGATAAVFTLIQGVLLTPPPYVQPDRLVLISPATSQGQTRDASWPAARWLDWQQHASSFEGVAPYFWMFNFLVRDQGSESLEGMGVTPEYFRVTGLRPLLGRTFLAAEVAPNAAPTVLIGYDLWRRTFNSDPEIVGKTLRISRINAPVTIIGVMPPGVRFLPSPDDAKEPNYDVNGLVDFWMPVAPDPKGLDAAYWDVVGRLKANARAADAQAELALLASRENGGDPQLKPATPVVQSFTAEANADGRRVLLPLLGAAALVLLIACGNTAALLLVRGLQRRREYAVRIALGVSRRTLVRQPTGESVLIAIAGGVLGLGLAAAIVRVMQSVGGHAIPRMDSVHVGWPVGVATLALALVAAALAGLAPAFRATQVDPNDMLKSAGPRSSGAPADRRLLRGLTIAQTALTLALLVGAGLLVRTMTQLWRAPAGFTTDHVLTMTVTAVQGDWLAFHRRALERVSQLSGVRSAAFAWGVPLTGTSWPGEFEIEGHPVISPGDLVSLPIRAVTTGYFALLGIPIVVGRDFRPTDDGKATRVAIVNQTLANRYFSNGTAVDKKIWGAGRNRPAFNIVGVVADSRPDDLTKSAEPELYVPLWQATAFSKDLIVRASGDPKALAPAIQQELRSTDPTVAIENVRTLDDVRAESVSSQMFATRLLVGFAGAAIVLALVGLYGVLSLSVASRRREIAIRSAVGARRGHIRALIIGEGVGLVVWGLVVGIALAIVLGRLLRVFLYGVQPSDPLTLFGASAAFVFVAALACWAPAARATGVEPLEALRSE